MIRLAVQRPVATAMIYAAAGLLGIAAWRNIPVELLPDVAHPRLHVRASWRGASPESMEAFVTSPVEAAVQQVRGVEKVESTSRERNGVGEAAITIEFAHSTDMDFARLDLSERLGALEEQLPPEVRGPFVEQYVPVEFRDQRRPFLQYTITGPHTPEALRAHVTDVVAPELRQVRGVADVVTQGGRDRMLEVQLDPIRASAFGVTPLDVQRAVEGLEQVQEAGLVRADGLLRTVAIRQRAHSTVDVLEVALRADRGRVVRLRDVATVHDAYEEPSHHYRVDGVPAVSFQVFREQGTNAIAVADRTKSALVEMADRHPPGVRVLLDEDESAAIRAQFTDLTARAALAAGIIFVVLLLFLRSLRSAVVVFATIGFAVLVTLNLVYFAGYTMNVLTLMGLVMGFGIIVDTSIVVLENIYRRRRLGEASPVAAERGTREVALALVVSTMTTIVVFIPFVYLQGELRLYYIPLALVTVLSQMAGLLVSFTFIPAAAAWLLGATLLRGEPATAFRRYSSLLRGTIRFPWATIAVALLMLAGAWYFFDKHVQRGTIWRPWWEQETYIRISVDLPRGEELARTDELARFFEQAVRRYPEVERFVTNVYPQSAQIRVTFADSIETTMIPLAIKEHLTAESFRFGGADVRVTGFGPSFHGGGSSPPNYSITVLGYNYLTVRNVAEALGARLQRFSRIAEVDVNATGRWFERDRATEIVLRVDRQRLAMHALTVQDILRHVSAAVGGHSGARGGVVRLGSDEARLAVKLSGAETVDVGELEELLLPARSGAAAVRLGDVATIDERVVLGRIEREDQQYRRNVTYEFRGPTKLGDRVQEAVIASTALPDGYKIEGREMWSWGDEEATQLWGVLGVSLLLIFMVTAALFESLRQPTIVLLTVPMALIGVFLIFWLTRASFSREAYIGVIMMGGIVVNNAILLIDRINQLRRAGGLPLEEAVVEGARQRVRPILMTSTSTIFGLLPLVLFSDYADANIWNALGFALIGGLTSSTILVLTVTPALYLLIERPRGGGPAGATPQRIRAAAVSGAIVLVFAAAGPRESGPSRVATTAVTIGGVLAVRHEGTLGWER